MKLGKPIVKHRPLGADAHHRRAPEQPRLTNNGKTGTAAMRAVRSGSVVSKSSTIPVAASGSTGGDAITGFALSYQETISTTNVGAVVFEQDNQPNVPTFRASRFPRRTSPRPNVSLHSGRFRGDIQPILISMGSCR
jgi:hypothetical protein